MDSSKKTNKRKETVKLAGDWKKKVFPALLVLTGIGLISFAGLRLLDRQEKIAPSTEASGIVSFSEIVTEDTDEPDENKPDVEVVEYEVPADMPRRIIMPELGVSGFVQQVGITEENAVAVPTNIHIAGWYNGSEKPGQEGLSIIDGHVGGRYTDGIFKQLSEASVGARFQIELGDRSIEEFEVVALRQLPENESAAYLFEKNNELSHQLNLITCGGEFNSDTQSFPDRIVVVSQKV